MPLHADGEAACTAYAHRLDHAIGSAALHDQPLAQVIDGLPVEAVDVDPRAAEKASDLALGSKLNGVARPVSFIHLAGRRAVVERAGELVDVGVQRAAE